METPDIAADETALQELKFGQGKAHRTTLKPLHWKEKKKSFVYLSSSTGNTKQLLLNYKVGHSTHFKNRQRKFSHKKASKIADLFSQICFCFKIQASYIAAFKCTLRAEETW